MNSARLNQPLPFHRTSLQPCPYIEGRLERKLVTELVGSGAVALYNELSRAGFRRSHRLAYHPACAGCTACQPVRIAADGFHASRSERRVLRANRDLTISLVEPLATVEQYRLFRRYEAVRHSDSEMAEMDFSDYRAMIEESPIRTGLMVARCPNGRLAGTCLIDWLDDGCSAVYSFYETEWPERSLGTWLVLQMVLAMRRRSLPFVYLGYLIAESPKMRYKARFQPLEVLRAGTWQPVPPRVAIETGGKPRL